MQNKKEYNSTAHTYLKAEAFFAEMIANGLSFNETRVVYNSNFKKSYRNEIDSVRIVKNKETNTSEMELVLNRDGIYDRLPEGMFHQSKGNSKTATTAQMSEEYRRFKEEEKMARKFFQPIEQELFRYATLVEQEELNLAFGVLNGDIKNELASFWNIPDGLPAEPVNRLVQIMPWVKMIKGEIVQTAKALELILDKPVRFEALEIFDHQINKDLNCAFFEELGIDTVLGGNFCEPTLGWKFVIENISNNEIADYRSGSSYGKLLKHFEEILIPLQIDIIFDFSVIATDTAEREIFLGYGLVI
jgi:hypothetical protein